MNEQTSIRVTHDPAANTVTIVLPCGTPAASKSGKTMVLASTHGFAQAGMYQGKALSVSVNVVFKP